MITLKKIIYKYYNTTFEAGKYGMEDFLKEITLQVIDEMIGEEKKNTDIDYGYNIKRQELKEYKKNFNK